MASCRSINSNLTDLNNRIHDFIRKGLEVPQDLIDRRNQFVVELQSCSLPQGTWQINGNGFPGQLRIDDQQTEGTVTGVFIDPNGTLDLVNAKWDRDARQLTFTRALPNGENQTFTGYLFDNSAGMAGTFVGDRFEDPRRPAFGWFAVPG